MNKVYCVVYHPVGDFSIIEGVFEKMEDAEESWSVTARRVAENDGDYVEIVEMKVE